MPNKNDFLVDIEMIAFFDDFNLDKGSPKLNCTVLVGGCGPLKKIISALTGCDNPVDWV